MSSRCIGTLRISTTLQYLADGKWHIVPTGLRRDIDATDPVLVQGEDLSDALGESGRDMDIQMSVPRVLLETRVIRIVRGLCWRFAKPGLEGHGALCWISVERKCPPKSAGVQRPCFPWLCVARTRKCQ